MAEIDDGALSFKSVMDNDQINAAIEETLRRVQGLSDGTVAGGKKMDAAFNSTADNIRSTLGQIGTACEMNEKELQSLETEYQRLGQKAGAAFMTGRDEEYNAITNQQAAIKGEITVRERLLQELRDQSDELEKVAQKQEENRQKTEENANTQVSMRSRIKALREEMMLLVDKGIDEQSEAYQRLKNELGRLVDIQSDVSQQGRTLANDEQTFQGIITGLSGLAGGFSAVTGAVSLFAGENEDLNKVMTKVQSVMAITIGLQQVAQTLNKDSAFQLVTLNSLKEWWRNVIAQATVAETAETIATTANTAAKEANAAATGEAAVAETLDTSGKAANTVAAATGTTANMTLAGAFRAVGIAISSIPVLGWIIAGITALATGVYALTSKQREAKKAQEEFTKSVVDGAYKSIGSVQFLSQQWKALGNDMDAKKKFIEQNKKAFDELSVSILDVADAEKLLSSGTQAFIDAQIAKAKTAATLKNSDVWVKQSIEADQELKEAKKTPKITKYVSTGMGGGSFIEVDNSAIKKAQDKQTEANNKLRMLYAQAAGYEKEGTDLMTKVGIDGAKKYAAGTVGAIEQAIEKVKEALDSNEVKGNNKLYLQKTKELENLQLQLDQLTGKETKGTSTKSKDQTKDLFLEKLETKKAEYARFLKWINSGDTIIAESANKEFSGLLKEGATYMEYLKRQRDQIMETPENKRTSGQQEQLTKINNQIADETQKTALDLFNTQLSDSLKGADTILAKLQKIADMRKDLKNDGTELDNSKKEKLDDAEKAVVQQAGDDYKKSLEDYKAYQLDKLKEDERYLKQKSDLEKQLAEATDPAQKKVIQTQLDTLNVKHDTKQEQNYDAMVEQYKNYQQRIADISADYDAKIAMATKKNNKTLVAELQKAKTTALGSEAMKELENSDIYNKLFGNLDNLTVSMMIELRDKLESEWSNLKLPPKELDALREKIESVNQRILSKNPFVSLVDAIERYKKAANDATKQAALKDMFISMSASIDQVKQAFDSVVDGIKKMGIASDEESQKVLSDISGIMAGATSLAMGIASGNPLQIVQGSIDLLSNGIDLITGGKDRKLNRQMKEHQKNVNELQRQYEALARSVDKALGSDKYTGTKEELNNLKAQQAELAAMEQAERDKKKTDDSKVQDYENRIAENATKMLELIDGLREDIMGGTAASIANDLGNAFIDAFSKGEDAAEAFNTKVDSIVANIIKKMLIQNLLEQPIGDIINRYSKRWLDDSGNFIGYDAVERDAGAMGAELKGVGSTFADAMENLPEEIKGYFTGDKTNTTLTGAVKGVSEETASLVAGQMNAMRINQLEATEILRQQQMLLSTIAVNTSYNVFLPGINYYIQEIKKMLTSNSLRSQGLS
jgi:hypothetical protein